MLSDLLHTPLLLKGVITEEGWQDIKDDFDFEFSTDAYYTESKEQEILRSRVEVLNGLAASIGTVFSKRYIQKNVLMLTDEEIDTIETEIMAEPQYSRQYQWSPLQQVQGEQPAPENNINNEVPGEGNPEPGPDNGA